MKKLLILFISIPLFVTAQENDLSVFKPLAGKTWLAEGSWGNGSKFKQEIKLEFTLDSTLVLVHSKGFTDQKQTKFGPRNHGVRQFDKASNSLKFWEYDVFGGRTEGAVLIDGKNILYQYQYGESTITDMWRYIDENTYEFIVGAYEDGTWKQTYLKTKFIAQPN